MCEYPIYCINLEHRKDRKEHSLQQFNELDVPHDKVTYLKFTKDARGGKYGCFDSHMKVWDNFFTEHPNKNYCLVFEDDFVISNNTKTLMKKATTFLDENCNAIDALFLHNLRAITKNKINNCSFSNGYGPSTVSYFITRHYIQSLLSKYGKLPEPTGRHFDSELSMNIIDKDNWIYSNNVFFTNEKCVTQLVDKSDNYASIWDEISRVDINENLESFVKIAAFLKKIPILDDLEIKQIMVIGDKILHKFTNIQSDVTNTLFPTAIKNLLV